MVDLSVTIAFLVVLATILFMWKWKCKTRKQLLEAFKQDWYMLKDASAALKDDREIVLEAVKQDGNALMYASVGLRNGGLREYLNHLKSNVFNVTTQTFIATILFGAKAAPSIPGSPHNSRSHLCDNSRCVLSLLRPSVCVPGSMSLQIKKLIWGYAGVRSGPKWDVIVGADVSLRRKKKKR